MLSPKGNSSMDNLAAIFGAIKYGLKVSLDGRGEASLRIVILGVFQVDRSILNQSARPEIGLGL